MTLMTCLNCQNQFSSREATCPECKEPNSNYRKTRRFIISSITGVAIGTIFKSPVDFGLYSIEKIYDNYRSNKYIIDAFKENFDVTKIMFTIATDFRDFKWSRQLDKREIFSFGRSDLRAQMSVMKTLDILKPHYVPPNIIAEEFSGSEGDIGLFGSAFTNVLARNIFGTCGQKVLSFEKIRLSISLAYRFCRLSDNELITRKEIATSFSEKAIHIVGENDEIYRSHLDHSGRPKNGFLLITKIPHPVLRGSYVLHVAGNTGPATDSVRLLLSGQVDMTSDEAKAFKDEMTTAEAYQIMFEASNLLYDWREKRDIFTELRFIKNSPRTLGVKVIGG